MTTADRFNITHRPGCPAARVTIREEPNRHGDLVAWCGGCQRHGLIPTITITPTTTEEATP